MHLNSSAVGINVAPGSDALFFVGFSSAVTSTRCFFLELDEFKSTSEFLDFYNKSSKPIGNSICDFLL